MYFSHILEVARDKWANFHLIIFVWECPIIVQLCILTFFEQPKLSAASCEGLVLNGQDISNCQFRDKFHLFVGLISTKISLVQL